MSWIRIPLNCQILPETLQLRKLFHNQSYHLQMLCHIVYLSMSKSHYGLIIHCDQLVSFSQSAVLKKSRKGKLSNTFFARNHESKNWLSARFLSDSEVSRRHDVAYAKFPPKLPLQSFVQKLCKHTNLFHCNSIAQVYGIDVPFEQGLPQWCPSHKCLSRPHQILGLLLQRIQDRSGSVMEKKLNVSKILCTNTIFVQTTARSEKSAHSFVTHINNFVVVRVIIECWLEESLFLNLLTILRVKFIVYIP